jgi:putative Mn2+ efflux pump MntP
MMNNMIFMILIFVLGLVLVRSSGKISKKIKNTCSSDDLRSANRGILVVGVISIVSSLAYMACLSQCECKDVGDFSTIVYMGFTFLLSIVLISLGSIVDKQSKKSGCEDTKGTSGTIILIGVIMLLLSGGWGGYNVYSKSGHMGSKSGHMGSKYGHMGSKYGHMGSKYGMSSYGNDVEMTSSF